jgi:hypothetical protein
MTTNRTPIARERRGRMTATQEMGLWLGTPAFESEDEARELWERNRGRLMAWFAHDGRRPAGWWEFDAPEGLVYDPDHEQSILYEAGLLTEPERDALLVYWREQFDRCHAPGWLGVCEGPGRWLKGREGRKAHLAWADVPKSLVERWTAERRSASRDRGGRETLLDREG